MAGNERGVAWRGAAWRGVAWRVDLTPSHPAEILKRDDNKGRVWRPPGHHDTFPGGAWFSSTNSRYGRLVGGGEGGGCWSGLAWERERTWLLLAPGVHLFLFFVLV